MGENRSLDRNDAFEMEIRIWGIFGVEFIEFGGGSSIGWEGVGMI